MSLFLEEWVRTRLGATIDFSTVGNEFFDGKLFFKILQSYDVVGPEVKQYFCRAHTPEDALKNLNLLRVSLKLLGVLKDNDVLEEIAKKDGSACLDLLNRLYLRLSNKHVLPIVTKGKEMQVLRQETGRFNVSKVLEKKCMLAPSKRPEEKLLSRLKTTINSFEKDAIRVLPSEPVKENKSKLVEALKKVRDDVEKNFKECKCGTTVEEYLNKFDEKMDKYVGGGDAMRTVCPPDEYVKVLKLRTLKQASDREVEAKLRDIIVKNIWCKQMKKREEEFRCSLADKLLKQSTYERDMVQRLGLIHLQHRQMIEKRRKIHEEAQRIYNERLETVEWRKDSLIDLEKDREKKRLQDLHRRLFDEKISRMRQERTDMITDILYDIVDFAIKISRFESEHLVKVSPRDLKLWKTLFFKSLPLLPKMQEITCDNMVSESGSEESFEAYVSKEELIDEVLDEHALNQYLFLFGPWAKELWSDLENVEEEMEVLGFAVHRLLEFKYPLPEPPEPADIPLYPIRAVLNNIHEVKAIKTLKALLDKPKIEIIELHTLINSCIAQYKKEMGLDEKSKKKKDIKTAESTKKGKKNKEKEPLFKSVEIQYPSIIDVEPQLSKFAELGKEAYSNLGTGLAISEELSSEILLEYLRNMTDQEGWVLLNFPADCRQVYHLEFKLTGLEPSIKCQLHNEKTEVDNDGGVFESNSLDETAMHESVACEDGSLESENIDELKLRALRTSRLLPRPNPAVPPIVFHSYFTNFIHLEQPKVLTEELKTSKHDSLDEINENNQSSENLVEDQTPKSFYENMDIYVHFPYTKMDFTTLKQLARTVIGESDEPGLERKSSFELFGDIAKDKSKKASSKKTVLGKSKLQKQSSHNLFEEENLVQVNDIEELPTTESVPCLVAEPCWEYTTLSIPDETQIALASLWESIELTYIQNLTDIFSFYREHDESVVPYRNMVFLKLTSLMETSDERQDLVTEFVSELNSVNDILRSHGETKKEMFCRIFELQLKLWRLCDSKKVSCETERQNIINENWLSKHLCGLYNIYVTMIETELDRFYDSLQLLQDYYGSSFGKAPSSSRSDKLLLPRYKLSDFDIEKETNPEPKIEDNAKDLMVAESRSKSFQSKRSVNLILSSSGIAETFATILLDPEYDTNFVEPFTDSMNELLLRITNEMSNTSNKQFSALDKEKKLILHPKQPKSRAATAKRKISSSSMSTVKADVSLRSLKESSLFDTVLKRESFQKALSEWGKAIQNETDRTDFRIRLIKNRFKNDLFELLDLMTETFHGLHNEISTRYFEQTRNCDNLLRVLMASVEAETCIQPNLILTLEKFQVELEIGSPTIAPPPPVSPIEEASEEFTFTVQQLTKFGEKMVSVSPLGITVESLIAVIEDMVLVGKENGYPYLPKGWSQLTRNEVRKVIRGTFGDIVMADWKDFLIFGLEFRFPTIQEIIETRDKFMALDPQRTETVNRTDFNSLQLWFESDLCDSLKGDLRVVLGKQFLFELYRTDSNNMNYTAFLLNYCKDENPIDGFGKALALATGTGYVLSEKELHLIGTEFENVESNKIASQVVDVLFQTTLDKVGEVTIYEVDNNDNPVNHSQEEFVVNDYGFFYAEQLLETPTITTDTATKTNTKSKTKSISKPKERNSLSSMTSLSANGSETKLDLALVSGIEANVQDSVHDIVWKSWLPRELVMSLLLTSLLTYALPENQFYIQKEVEDEINRLYSEKGIRDCIEGHVLAQSQFIKDLFSKCFKFKSCNLTQLVKLILYSSKPPSNFSNLTFNT